MLWLLLDALNMPNLILGFLIVGAIPGTTMSVPPLAMLVFQMSAFVIICFEILARRSKYIQHIRSVIISFILRHTRLSFQPFKRA